MLRDKLRIKQKDTEISRFQTHILRWYRINMNVIKGTASRNMPLPLFIADLSQTLFSRIGCQRLDIPSIFKKLSKNLNDRWRAAPWSSSASKSKINIGILGEKVLRWHTLKSQKNPWTHLERHFVSFSKKNVKKVLGTTVERFLKSGRYIKPNHALHNCI